MGRIPRIYQANVVYEVTTRTIQGRFLLRPSPETNDLISGIVGRAQSLLPSVKVYGLSVLSNHMTWMLSSSTPRDIPAFMGYVNGRISRDIGRLVDWPGKFFERPAMPIPIADDDALLSRFSYLLSQGVKENLVEKAEQWPGVSCVPSLLGKSTLEGTWYQRDKMRRLFLRKHPPDKKQYTRKYTVQFSKLPGKEDLSEKDYVAFVQGLVTHIEREALNLRKQDGKPCLGPTKVQAVTPHHRPQKLAKSPAPRCHASTKAIRMLFVAAWKLLVQWFKDSSEALKNFDLNVTFPDGSFPSPFPMAKEGEAQQPILKKKGAVS